MKANIVVERPVVFIKAFTTGADYLKDRIIELSIIKFENGKEPISVSRRYNPEMPISKEVIEIHGIQDLDVSSSPLFVDKASGLMEFLKDCDIVGFNVREFDLLFLVQEFSRAKEHFTLYDRKIVDLFYMYKKMNDRTFETATKQYLGVCSAKDSKGYLQQSVELMNSMLNNHEINSDIESLSMEFNPKLSAIDSAGNIVYGDGSKKATFVFGKYKGEVVSDVALKDPNYSNWLTINAVDKIPSDTIEIIKRIFSKTKK